MKIKQTSKLRVSTVNLVEEILSIKTRTDKIESLFIEVDNYIIVIQNNICDLILNDARSQIENTLKSVEKVLNLCRDEVYSIRSGTLKLQVECGVEIDQVKADDEEGKDGDEENVDDIDYNSDDTNEYMDYSQTLSGDEYTKLTNIEDFSDSNDLKFENHAVDELKSLDDIKKEEFDRSNDIEDAETRNIIDQLDPTNRKCPKCGKEFTLFNNLKKHIKYKHGKEKVLAIYRFILYIL